jgi:hypothetical protein
MRLYRLNKSDEWFNDWSKAGTAVPEKEAVCVCPLNKKSPAAYRTLSSDLLKLMCGYGNVVVTMRPGVGQEERTQRAQQHEHGCHDG